MYSNILKELDKVLEIKNEKSKESIRYISGLQKEILELKDENKRLRDDMQELSRTYFELTKQK
jgi:FtsZ-binding cell division protein ZapB